MSRVKISLDHKRIRRLVWLVLTFVVLLSYSLQNAAGSAYYNMVMQPYGTVSSPPVILEEGTAGSSTIYVNKTSAKVNVTAPLFGYVDNNDCDVDSSADKGMHSNFTTQKYSDSIYDTLSEADTGGAGETLLVYSNSYDSVSGGVTNPTYIYGAPNQQYAECAKNEDIYSNGSATDIGTIAYVYFNVTYYGAPSGTGVIAWRYQLDDGGFVLIKNLATGGTSGSPLTDTYDATSLRASWSWTDINNTDVQVEADGGSTPWIAYVDAIYMTVVTQGATNYELDLEIQWTSVDYDEANEELCIKTGTFSGSEDIMVYAWNVSTSDWHFLYNLTASSWNNVSVTDWLNNENFTARFLGGTETSDTNQDSWNIDTTLLHVWTSEGTYDYVLKVVNQVADNWTVNLQVYNSSNIDRLSSLNISLHDGTTSNQIAISGGSIIKSEGEPYNLTGGQGSTIYISMSNLQASTSGTSCLYVYLKILVPDTSTYLLYIITFEIT